MKITGYDFSNILSNISHLRIRDLLKIPVRLGVVRATSAISIFIGGLVLLGWYFDLEILEKGFPGSPVTMKANTALCFVLSGLSLWISQGMTETRRVFYPWLSRCCTVTVVGICLLTIIQYVWGWNFGIDEFLFRDSPIVLTTSHPGRMGFNTALSFILINVAIYLIIQPNKQRSYWVAQIFTIIAALICFQSLMRYAYKEDLLYHIALQTTSMALHTAVTLMILSMGILWASSRQGLMRVITNDSYGGLIARRLLLPAITIPFLLGWLVLNGERARIYDSAFGISLFAIIVIIVFTILVWQSALIIDRLSQQRNRAQEASKENEEKLQSFVNSNVIGIVFGDINGGIYQANKEFLRIIDYTQEDLLAGRIDWRHLTPPEYLYLDEQAIAQAKSSRHLRKRIKLWYNGIKSWIYPEIMSNIVEYIHNNPEESQRLLGLHYEQVKQLIEKAIELHNNKKELAESKKVRLILGGGGRKQKLTPESQIILTLTYLRHLTTFQLLGIQFGVSETTANDTFNHWFPLLGELLPPSLISQVKKTPTTTKLLKNC